jgi:hypothetical protein
MLLNWDRYRPDDKLHSVPAVARRLTPDFHPFIGNVMPRIERRPIAVAPIRRRTPGHVPPNRALRLRRVFEFSPTRRYGARMGFLSGCVPNPVRPAE